MLREQKHMALHAIIQYYSILQNLYHAICKLYASFLLFLYSLFIM